MVEWDAMLDADRSIRPAGRPNAASTSRAKPKKAAAKKAAYSDDSESDVRARSDSAQLTPAGGRLGQEAGQKGDQEGCLGRLDGRR